MAALLRTPPRAHHAAIYGARRTEAAKNKSELFTRNCETARTEEEMVISCLAVTSLK